MRGSLRGGSAAECKITLTLAASSRGCVTLRQRAQIWRVYQRGLEQWLADLLQPTFDGLVEARSVPAFVKRLKIVEFTVDHAAPYFTNMRRRTSRKVGLPAS